LQDFPRRLLLNNSRGILVREDFSGVGDLVPLEKVWRGMGGEAPGGH